MNAYLVFINDGECYIGTIKLSKNLKKAVEEFRKELKYKELQKINIAGIILARDIQCNLGLPLLWCIAREEYQYLFPEDNRLREYEKETGRSWRTGEILTGM